MAKMSFLVVIPARYQSTRFPGKPLADLGGSPLIEHVWRRCCEAVDSECVIIATDDDRIREVAQSFGARVEMTSPDCLTGTDRVAEVAGRNEADWYINVQGDEPFIEPESIRHLLNLANAAEPDVAAINAMSEITEEADFWSLTVPKVVNDNKGRLLFISRAAIPHGKDAKFRKAHRQIGIYAYRRSGLEPYFIGGEKSALEQVEDIEILRLLETGAKIQMFQTKHSGCAVDTVDDLERAKKIFQSNSTSPTLSA